MDVFGIDLETASPEDVDRACRATGFLSVSGHGVSEALIEETFSVARRFFDLPVDEKMRVALAGPKARYGYSPLAGETLSRSRGEPSPPDLKESFSIGPEPSWDGPFEGAETLWPERPAELAPVLKRYFVEMSRLASRLLSLLARSLELEPDFFEPAIDRHASALRLLDYPRIDTPNLAGQLRASAHSDYGSLTILAAQPGSRGLEIFAPDGAWREVEIVEGALIVNLGDLMARWSNDRWVSTLHRAVLHRERRQSIAFFHLPNWNCEVRSIGPNPKYPPVTAGQYLVERFEATQ